jgi:hypothetical protein
MLDTGAGYWKIMTKLPRRVIGFIRRFFTWLKWRLQDGIYCPFCGSCGDEMCGCGPCDGGRFCPYPWTREEND